MHGFWDLSGSHRLFSAEPYPVSALFQLEKSYPFQANFMTVGKGGGAAALGFQMHYVDEGSGPVVICLHGNPTWGFFFRHLITELKNDFRVIVPDHIGCGLSAHPANAHFRAADRIAHLQELLVHLGIERFSLVMHDWGGPIGTGLAVRTIQAVERMVYFNTTLAETALLPAMIRRAAAPLIGNFLTKQTMRFLKLMTRFGVASSMPLDVKQGYYFPYATRARRTAIWDFVQDITFQSSHPSYRIMREMVAKLPELADVPVKIIWGLRDPCFHLEVFKRVAAYFPHADIVKIPHASHLVLEDAPQLTITEVRDFLTAIPKAASPSPRLVPPGGLYGAFQAAAAAVPLVAAATRATFPRLSRTPRYETLSFRALADRVCRYENGLAALGLLPGERVIMLVSPGADFLALSYAVMGRGGVPVFIDPGMGVEAVVACIREARPSGFIGVPKAHLLRLKDRRLFQSLKFSIVANRFPLAGFTTLRDMEQNRGLESEQFPVSIGKVALRQPEDVALVAFTSGATGLPKGVVFTNQMLTQQLTIFQAEFGFRAGEQDLPLLPIFSLFTSALGVGSIFPPLNPSRPLSLYPAKIVRVMQDLGNETSFGSPALWNKLGTYCRQTGQSLPQLRRVFMAGAPVSSATIDLVQAACPGAQSFTPYGATEALPVTIAAAADLRHRPIVTAVSGEMGTPVGRVVAGVSLRIVDPKTIPTPEQFSSRQAGQWVDCPPRTIGEILVSGATVSAEYLHRPEATAAGKFDDGQRIWHRMGDMGYLDEAGELYFCGRRVHMVTTPERVFHSVPVENVFNQHARVHRSALIGVGGKPAIVVEPRQSQRPVGVAARRRFAEELQAIGAHDPVTAAIQRFYFNRSFPVDVRHNAKIFRDRLAHWATTQTATVVGDLLKRPAGTA